MADGSAARLAAGSAVRGRTSIARRTGERTTASAWAHQRSDRGPTRPAGPAESRCRCDGEASFATDMGRHRRGDDRLDAVTPAARIIAGLKDPGPMIAATAAGQAARGLGRRARRRIGNRAIGGEPQAAADGGREVRRVAAAGAWSDASCGTDGNCATDVREHPGFIRPWLQNERRRKRGFRLCETGERCGRLEQAVAEPLRHRGRVVERRREDCGAVLNVPQQSAVPGGGGGLAQERGGGQRQRSDPAGKPPGAGFLWLLWFSWLWHEQPRQHDPGQSGRTPRLRPCQIMPGECAGVQRNRSGGSAEALRAAAGSCD